MPHAHGLAPDDPGAPEVSRLAVGSLVAGTASLFCSFFAGIPAILMGILALGRIQRSGGRLTGGGFAVAGIITGTVCGVIGTAILAGLAAPLVIRQKQKAEEMMLVRSMTEFHADALIYQNHHGSFPEARAAAAMLDEIRVPRGFRGSWTYFPAAASADEPLLVSPDSNFRLVLNVSGQVVPGDPADESLVNGPGAVRIQPRFR